MLERPGGGERAVLVHVDFPNEAAHEEREELRDLVISAGAEIVGWVTASRERPDPRFLVGAGKAEEIRDAVAANSGQVVIFNHPLTPAQERNLEQMTACRVLDRIGLILDIFAQRASSFEGKLQVELAQLKHIASRLVRGWTHLERQKGGIGLRGPGEKQLETDRRLVAERIRHINQRLQRVARRRDLSRRARGKASIPLVSLVGYTNAGKSTLFNALTDAGVVTEDRLFATLDPTLRRLELAGAGTVILADTVGFIRHLPHELIAAFRATLEETRRANLLLHVIDACGPDRRAKTAQVNAVLAEIGAGEIPQIEVYNKIDLDQAGLAPRREPSAGDNVSRLWLSARTGAGVDTLAEALKVRFAGTMIRRRVFLAPSEGRLRARIHALGTVVEEHSGTNGEWVMDIEIRPAHLDQLVNREGLDRASVAPLTRAA